MKEEQMRAEFEAWFKEELINNLGNSEDEAKIALKFEGQRYIFGSTQDRWESWKAALNSLEGKSVPVGYAIVPFDPTDEMRRAGIDAPAYGHPETATPSIVDIYKAMLAAAPQPPQEDRLREWFSPDEAMPEEKLEFTATTSFTESKPVLCIGRNKARAFIGKTCNGCFFNERGDLVQVTKWQPITLPDTAMKEPNTLEGGE